MLTMNWTEQKENIYYWDGSWRDIYVLETSLDDNLSWTNYVNENYRIEWFNGLTQKDEGKIDFEVIRQFWNGNQDLCSTAKVFIEHIQINNHFFVHNEIENDIDPREVNSIEEHDKIVKYMSDLSLLLDKPIILTPENDKEIVLIKVSKSGIEYAENIKPNEWKIKTR
jgi:hypothetical protein